MSEILSVFIGGGIGASLRYLLALFAIQYGFSYQGTFAINILGCIFFGFVIFWAIHNEKQFHKNLKLFLLTGVAGGFTTFSTFGLELFKLIASNQIRTGIFYMLFSLIVGIAAIGFGIFLAGALSKFAPVESPEPEFMESEIEEVMVVNEEQKILIQ